jgi:hypothetical protein
MSQKFRNKMLAIKAEPSYGNDSKPTGKSNAIVTKNLEIQLMQGNTAQRNTDRPYTGNDITYYTDPHTKLAFDVELAGSGKKGLAPAYGILFRMCGFQQTIKKDESVEFTPISDMEESASCYYQIASELHKVLGARGTFSINFGQKDMPSYHFEVTGLHQSPKSAKAPEADYSHFKAPKPVSFDNTPVFELFGYKAVMESLSLDMNIEVAHRTPVNSKSVPITGRSASGEVTIELPRIDDINYHNFITNHLTGSLSMQHGIEAGNIIDIYCPKVQLLNPRIGESEGVATLTMGLGLIPDSGNDEILIRVR